MRTLLLLVFVLGSVVSGCATIMTQSTVDVSLATNPPGAKAHVNGQTYMTTTPVTIPVKRGKEPVIHIEKDGYEAQDVKLNKRVGGWVWGNVIFGGLIGFAVDLATEHAYGIDPDELNITLVPVTLSAERNLQVASVPPATPPKLPPNTDVDAPPILGAHRRKNAHAVVIGLEQYRNQLPKADYAERDAKLVSEYLSKTMGFDEANIAVLVNDRASKSDFEKYIETWLPNRVEQDDTVFVYYSGHGAPNTKNGDGYLVPYDGDPVFLENTAYPLERLYRSLAKLPAREVIVVLDSCFSGAGGRSVLANGMRPIVTEVRSPLLAAGKTIVLAASTGQQVTSTYEQKGHGLLTYFFLKGLTGDGDTNKDGNVEITELFDYLRPKVERTARREFNNEQTPQLLGSAELLSRGINLVELAR